MIFRSRNRRDIDAARRRQDALARRALQNALARVEEQQLTPWTQPGPEDPVDLTCDPCGAGPLKSTGDGK